jgi:deazaflavin-dependent oxidoreductase (nitroreductase family)
MISADKKLRLKLERPIVVFIYRLLARWLGRYPFLLLTTTGRKSKRKRTVPVVFMQAHDGFIVVAANMGSDADPGWFWNLKANPQAEVQIGSAKMIVQAEVLRPGERESLWSKWVQVNPGYEMFQERTVRMLPVVILKPSKSS